MMARRKVYAGEVGEGAGRSQRRVQAIERVASTLQIFPTVGTLVIPAAYGLEQPGSWKSSHESVSWLRL